MDTHPTTPEIGGTTPSNAGPLTFSDAIKIYPTAFTTPSPPTEVDGDVDDVTVEVISTMLAEAMTSSPERALAFEVLGRLIGTSIAHEIVHSLIGGTLSGGGHNKDCERRYSVSRRAVGLSSCA